MQLVASLELCPQDGSQESLCLCSVLSQKKALEHLWVGVTLSGVPSGGNMAANICGHKTVLGVFPAHTDWSCSFKKRWPQKGCGAALVEKSWHSRARMFLFERVPAARPQGVTQRHVGNWLPEHWKGKGPGPLEPLGGASELKVCSSHLCGGPFSPWCGVNEDSGGWEG